ncbi:carbamate kinase [Lactococcus cremoris subsp. cremoris UC509.9]|uniref:Carbamate kinase n=1 Tax=Lactococcus lactis subsp. cremoris TaxID=1359 RepID=A0AAJ6MJ47_LACLC|nr:carbamate kinase [Lactococcus cremoris]AFW92434.1 carbamate kinase [Lactococcus cremoris subsp. cremoris UC509.9]ARD92181.1 carbamate kinase [Lactococcus cremoris]MRM69438.1 carbamate kinase [Lactococcus cremoris]QJD18827.1 carbamate kinase [Lactococcus cremoris]QRZ30710.1 carbamate kinase [Lactococcus cremoris]
MVSRIVVALGGNAILTKDPSAAAQKKALEVTAEQLMPLIKDNDRQMVVTHGNGPQVGNLLLQQLGSDSEKNPAMPLDTVGAMTQGEIGFWTVQAFTRAMANNGLERYPVISAVTQTLVDENDPAFKNASKPIGPFYTEEQLPEIKKQFPDWELMEDAGRGYRRVVPSPKPLEIIEAKAFGPILESGSLLIASGGGGIPVIKDGNGYKGVEAVIDKDFSAAKLAEMVGADELLILTAVDNVFVNFNKPNQKKLETVTMAEMKAYIKEGQFAAGSMLPKVEAAMEFVTRTGRPATITSLENLEDFLNNDSGTKIIP